MKRSGRPCSITEGAIGLWKGLLKEKDRLTPLSDITANFNEIETVELVQKL